jgi:glycosyltransferase involved in cell wall biosynthesis
MRIAQVLTRGDVLGGAQTHVRDLSEGLLNLGHEVTVVTGAPGVFSERLYRIGIPTLHIKHLVRPVKPLLDLAALYQLCRVLRQLKPDLVCAHTAKAGWLARAAARLLGIPSVFTPHGWSMVDRSSLECLPVYCLAERLGARLGTRIINVCEFERELAKQFGVGRASALDIVHNGVPDIVSPRTRPVDAQPPTLVMVARFEGQKDHGTLLHALSGLLSMKWQLLLVGDGEREAQVRAQIDSLGLAGRVQILPAETDVNSLLTSAQIFVLTTNFEALPISILEAMRAGVPVVATDVGGIAESVRDRETGLLVERGDVPGLRDALARLIHEPAFRADLGKAGRRLYAAQFTSQAMVTRTVEVYQRAIAERAPNLSPVGVATQ